MLNTLTNNLRSILVRRKKYRCPVCGNAVSRFEPLPEYFRNNAEKHGYVHFGQGEMTALETYACPLCAASDRERLYAHWIEQEIQAGRLPRATTIIHFAPEQQLSKKLAEEKRFRYETADLKMKTVNHIVDITNLPFPDDSYDFFICSHVLEHIENDDQAIQELFRTTRCGGRGILMAPIIVGLDHTHEDPSITGEAGRWKNFGQNDHVRLYAHDDYVEKIQQHGFRVHQLGIDYFGQETYEQLGLKSTSILYIAEKPGDQDSLATTSGLDQ